MSSSAVVSMKNPVSGRKPNSVRHRGVVKNGFPSEDLTSPIPTVFVSPSVIFLLVLIQV